jgi:hypothetical protein
MFFFSTNVFASNIHLYGTRPFTSLTHRLNERWNLNLFYSETINLSDLVIDGVRYPSRDFQSYIQSGFIYKFSPNLNFTFGYVFQRNNPFSDDFSNENRLWQQILYSQNLYNGKLSHRFRFEQRFIQNRSTGKTNPMATRLRYQVAFTSPFIGSSIVSKSWFYSLYNEFYFSTSGLRNAFYSENWSYAGVGYQTLEFGKFEFGPLFQFAFTDKDKDWRLFTLAQLGWSQNF